MQVKNYSLMIDGQNLFNQPLRNNGRTDKNIENCYCSRRWLLFVYSVICVAKKIINWLYKFKQTTNTCFWSKSNSKGNFIRNLNRVRQTTMILIIEEVKEFILGFLQGTVRVLQFCFYFNKVSM